MARVMILCPVTKDALSTGVVVHAAEQLHAG
jgi:hypothetical protein